MFISIMLGHVQFLYTINVITTSFYSCFYILILHMLCRKKAHVTNVICYTKTDRKYSFLYSCIMVPLRETVVVFGDSFVKKNIV